VGFYLNENGKKALFDPFSQKLYYVSIDVGVQVFPNGGGFFLPYQFLGGG